MARHAFSLSDASARVVMAAAEDLGARYPASAQNREFLQEFIRAARTATGRDIGVPTIQRLLRIYAPARRPSTATILQVKKLVESELQAGFQGQGESQPPSSRLDQRDRHGAAVCEDAAGPDTALRLLEIELAELRRRLQQTEAERRRVADALEVATGELGRAQGEVAGRAQAYAELAGRVEQLAGVAARAVEAEEGVRKFALQAIEAARAESRTWRERYEGLMTLRTDERALLETYRQAAKAAAARPR